MYLLLGPRPGPSAQHSQHQAIQQQEAQMCIYQNTDVPMFGLELPKMKRATQSYWLTQAYARKCTHQPIWLFPSICPTEVASPVNSQIVAVWLAFSSQIVLYM